MSSAFLVRRLVVGAEGQLVGTVAVQAFTTMEAAQKAAQASGADLRAWADYQLAKPTAEGYQLSGMTALQFLQSAGIDGFDHVIDEIELVDSSLVVQTPTIIVPQ